MIFGLLRYSGRDCVILGAYRYGKQSGCGDLEISQTTFDSSSFNIRHLETFSDFKTWGVLWSKVDQGSEVANLRARRFGV